MARRVLLTAYADTHAAIDAINVVDLDHYLLKPWDPPEEKLYPVIDGLLEAWQAVATGRSRTPKSSGTRWNARSSEVREFLARNRLILHLVPWPTNPTANDCSRRRARTACTLPVVITEQGEALVSPTDTELAPKLGLDDHASGGLLRSGGHRRWARRSGRSGLRRVRRTARPC